MEQYVGLDVSQKETAICVIDGEGKRVWQGTCRSIPDVMAEVVRTRAPLAVKVAMETGPLAVWHWHELKKAGVPIVCIHACHAKAALSMQINKTDANDAFGLAQIVRTASAIASGVERHVPCHTRLPSASITQIAVSFWETSKPTYCSIAKSSWR